MSNEMICLHVMQQPRVPNPPLWWRVLTVLLASADGGPCGGREQYTKVPFGISGISGKDVRSIRGHNSGYVLEIW